MFKRYLILILIAFSPLSLAAVTYQVKDVIKINGYPTTVKINNSGVISSYTVDGPHQSDIFIYDSQNEELVFLRAFDSECTRLFDFNNKNEIIGCYYTENFSPLYGKMKQVIPFTWSKEKGYVSLELTLGHICSNNDSFKINDLGWMSGYGCVNSIFDFYTHNGKFKTHYSSLIWMGNKNNSIVLNHSTAPDNFGVCIKSINNKADAVGGIFYNSGQHSEIWQPAYAFLWDSVQGKILPLGNLGGQDKFYSCATDINDAKQIVGLSEVDIKKHRHGRCYYHAFLWDKAAMFDLGTLDQNQDSIAYAINSQGDVVGKSGSLDWLDAVNRAFIWTRKEGMVDLNSLIDSDTNCKLHEALDINDIGQIVCLATINGEGHIVLLTPEY